MPPNTSTAARSRCDYLTDAVLPIYVVHQPILLVAAYLLLPLSLPVLAEVVLIVAITGLGSLLFYELVVRRWRVIRFLFGLRLAAAPSATGSPPPAVR